MEKQKEEEKRLSKEKNGWRGEERSIEPTCTHVIHSCSFHTYKFAFTLLQRAWCHVPLVNTW